MSKINDFRRLKRELLQYKIDSVAKASGVAASTIYFWLSGYTTEPQERTLNSVKGVIIDN